ncbi:jg14850 [Pararge aegeria aegeria]|uniref:Jg14850 protein n=1 Tax=Pararge aegeria aegeria TaxID=348720 RepID=A0A8S4R596_9NEOP|nr:jg14850 [Pararge aegeria aegeria]
MIDPPRFSNTGWWTFDLNITIKWGKKREVCELATFCVCEAILEIGGCWNGSPVLVNAALGDPLRGGRTTLGASQVASGFKRHKTVEFGTPNQRPMSIG